jgi:hypothetical protein
MNATVGSKYPKIEPVVAHPGVTNPYTVQFARSFESQLSRIKKANLNLLADKIPGYDTLSFQYNKVFWVDGARLSYPIVLAIGFAKGCVWACLDGVAIRETLKPKEPSHFWTETALAKYPIASYGQIPEPFGSCEILRAGLFTPMSPENQALVRYFTILHAKDTGLTKHRLEFPDFEALEEAFRLLTPNAAEHVESSDARIEDSDATKILSREDDYIGPVVSPARHRTHTSPPGPQPPVQPIVPRQDSEAPIPDEKRQRDINTVLSHKRHIKTQVENQYRLADYKDYEARRLLNMGEQWVKDANECLKKARKARMLAKEEQMEVDAIDKLLERELGGDLPMENTASQGSRVAHLTPYGVKGLGR